MLILFFSFVQNFWRVWKLKKNAFLSLPEWWDRGKETIKGIAIKLEISRFSFPITYSPFPIPHFTVTSVTYSHEAIVLVAAAVKTLICLIKPGAHY